MITPSFGLTATERVLPKLALDFTTAVLDPRVTFTRAGDTATVVNSDGYISGINANLPRFDYNSTTLACKGLLIEEVRTNSITYSNEFSNGAWYTLRASVTSVTETSPANDATVFNLIEDTTASNNHRIGQSFTSAATTYTYSIFAKPAGRNWIQLCSAALTGVFFDIQNGTVGAANSGHVGQITPYKNGWYRCSITFTSTSGNRPFEIALATANSVTSYTGDGVSGVSLYGAEIEAGAFATSYIPTEATSVTRNADVATMTGTNFSSWFNASEGTFTGQGALLPNSPSGILLCPNNGGVAERFRLLLGTTGGAWIVSAGGSTVAGIGVRTLSGKTTGSYKLNNFTVATNGADYATDGSGAVPTGLDRMVIGSETAGSPTYLNGWVQKIMYYPQQLTPNEIVAFSK
jgi:hypothetical protein